MILEYQLINNNNTTNTYKISMKIFLILTCLNKLLIKFNQFKIK